MGARVQLRDEVADAFPNAHTVTAERFFDRYLAFEGDHKTFATVCLCGRNFRGWSSLWPHTGSSEPNAPGSSARLLHAYISKTVLGFTILEPKPELVAALVMAAGPATRDAKCHHKKAPRSRTLLEDAEGIPQNCNTRSHCKVCRVWRAANIDELQFQNAVIPLVDAIAVDEEGG
jgi:hypothetical protein